MGVTANFDEKAFLPLVAKSAEGELRFVLSSCANHGDLLLQKLMAEFIVAPQSICHIKCNLHPMVLLQASTGQLPSVDLHLPGVAGLCATGTHILVP